MDKLSVNMIFLSIQGEGILTGCPTVFIRLALCNLRCSFCDTRETWDWDHYKKEDEITEMTIDEVAAEINKYYSQLGYEPNVVITGGEPLLQQKILYKLIPKLLCHKVEVETNGTIAPNVQMCEMVDNFNVSIKLNNSGNAEKARLKPYAIESFVSRPNAYFKFVVSTPDDLKEILDLKDLYNIPRDKILLMPEGKTESEIQSKLQWLSEICVKNGFILSNRLQVMTWGDKRGV